MKTFLKLEGLKYWPLEHEQNPVINVLLTSLCQSQNYEFHVFFKEKYYHRMKYGWSDFF